MMRESMGATLHAYVPHLDGCITGGREQTTTIIGDKDRTNVVGMTDELGDLGAQTRIIKSDSLSWRASSKDLTGWDGSERVNRGANAIVWKSDEWIGPSLVQVPQHYLSIKTCASDPVGVRTMG